MFRLNTWQAHALAMVIIAMALVYFQAYVLGRMSSPWFHVDLATIFVVYLAVEHLLLGALVRILVVASLMQMFSGTPNGFYLMFYLLALVVSNVLAKFFAVHKLSSQFLIFAGIFCLKFVMIYASLSKIQRVGDFYSFILEVLPSVIVTTLFSVPMFAIFSKIDAFFDSNSRRDHRQEMVEN